MLQSRPSIEAQTRQIEQLRAKLLAAETLCEELMDENEDMKKELRDLEEEIEEMQDNFRYEKLEILENTYVYLKEKHVSLLYPSNQACLMLRFF